MVDLDGVSSLHASTCFAVRAQTTGPDLSNEARVAERVAEGDHLVIERTGPHVAVVGEAKSDVVLDH